MWKMGSSRHLEMGRATRKRTAPEHARRTLGGSWKAAVRGAATAPLLLRVAFTVPACGGNNCAEATKSMSVRFSHAMILVATLLLAVLFVALWRTVYSRRSLLPVVAQLAPGVTQRARDFRRTQVKNGKTVWEVAAAEVEYSQQRGEARIRDVTLRWYLDDGRVIGIHSDVGTVKLGGNQVDSVSVTGNVVLSLGTYEVQIDEARYDRAAQKIFVPGRVQLKGDGIELTGTAMELDLATNRLTMHHDVAMVLSPAHAGKETSHAF